MIKLIATRDFTLREFKKVKIVERAGKDEEGWLYKNDVFICDTKMANYLLGNNDQKNIVAKVIEIIPTKKK